MRYQALNERTSPRRSATNRPANRTPWSCLFMAPTWSTSPVRSTRSAKASASATVEASGFSTRTCFPAASASAAIEWWNRSGAATITASTDGSVNTSRWSVCADGTP